MLKEKLEQRKCFPTAWGKLIPEEEAYRQLNRQIAAMTANLFQVMRIFEPSWEKRTEAICDIANMMNMAVAGTPEEQKDYVNASLYEAFNIPELCEKSSWLGGITGQYDINMAWSAMGYALLGHYLNTRDAEKLSLRGGTLMFLAGFALTFGGTALASVLTGENALQFMEGMSPGPALMAAGLCRRFAQRASSARVARLVKASFAVYLIHMAFVMAFRQFGFDLTVMPPLLAVPVQAACVLALSLAGWWVLSKIPIVKDRLI